MRFVSCAALLGLLAAPDLAAQPAEPLDWLIQGGAVLDGTGNPSFPADVGIRGGRIVEVGRLRGFRARRIVDARGKLVVPGFIDLHSHAEEGLASSDPRRRAAPNLVSQGITTVAVNPDGFGPWPLAGQRADLERAGVGPNVVLMVGHNTVRRLVLGEDHRRAATPHEIDRMCALVREGMKAGAFGLSAGLEYVPGIWSTTDELVALVGEIVPYGGVYIAHQRSESTEPRWYLPSRDPKGLPTLLEATQETIEIGAKTGARVVASHLKVMGAHYWGTAGAVVRLIEQARRRGIDIWADQYPYHSTGGDGSMTLIPGWAAGLDLPAEAPPPGARDYAAAVRRTMQDASLAEKARRDIAHEMSRRGGPENIVVFDHPDRRLIGKTLHELAAARGLGPVEMALELQYEGYRDRLGGTRLRGFSVWEEDLKLIMAQPWVATSTDAGIALPEDGPVHARFYGSYPRKLRRYALDGGAIRFEDAVRSSTSLPAAILGLADRGLLRKGFRPDLVVLDPARLSDKATFFEPHQHSDGVELVLVNGVAVLEEGKLTGELPGQVLRPQRAAPTR